MKKITLLLLLSMLILHVSAQWSANPSVNNAISDLSGEQVLPKIGVCSDGSMYIAFFSNVSGSYNVRLQRLDNDGNELWVHNGILISDHPTDSWVSDWDMAVDASNHAVLTFSDIREGDNWEVYAYRISPSGDFVWGVDGIALSNNSALNVAPKVTCTSAGNSVFAWMSDNVIIMQKITPGGIKQWGDNGITLSSSNSLTWPQLMPVGDDEIIMKYFNDAGNPPYPTRHVFTQRYNSAGQPVWSNPATISTAGGVSSWTQIFSFINDGSDGFYIAWHDDRDNNMLASAFIQHINSSGQAVWTNNGIEICTLAGRNHFNPHISLPAGSSDVYVFWNEMDGDQNQRGISVQKISAEGTRVWGVSGLTLIPLSFNTVTPEAASSTGTDIMLLYSSGLTGTEQLYGMRVATNGTFVWNPSSKPICQVPSSKVHPVMSKFFNDQWIICWEDDRNDASDIYAQNLAIDGSLGPYEVVFGHIQGQVTLTGGSGNITEVVVTAGSESTFPDENGNYIMEVQTGTYTVTASLNGYYNAEVTGVVVLEDQSTNNVNLELFAIPTTGWIEGTVELFNGDGDVSQTIITVGELSTNPDSTGFYSIEVGVGTWSVYADLEGYTPLVRGSIHVLPGEVTSGVDFLLTLIPVTGYLYGTVSIEGNMADVTLATVSADTLFVNPDSDGDYVMELPVGTHNVQVNHPYTVNGTATVVIEPGSSTNQDFNLLMLRRDLIVKCFNQWGTPTWGLDVEINGPEGHYSQEITTDSLVIPMVPYGYYTGSASLGSWIIDYSDTIIDQTNNLLAFNLFMESANSNIFSPVIFYPNPINKDGVLKFDSDRLLDGLIEVYDNFGRKYSEIYIKAENQQDFPVTLLFNTQNVTDGVYLIRYITSDGTFTGKILIKD